LVPNSNTQNVAVVADKGPWRSLKGSVPGSKGGWVSVRDAVKRKLPDAAPKPGAFKAPVAAAVAAPEAVKE
jgi:large subunit ribosomal protein L3